MCVCVCGRGGGGRIQNEFYLHHHGNKGGLGIIHSHFFQGNRQKKKWKVKFEQGTQNERYEIKN